MITVVTGCEHLMADSESTPRLVRTSLFTLLQNKDCIVELLACIPRDKAVALLSVYGQ